MGFAKTFPGYRFEQDDPRPSTGKGDTFDILGTVYWTVDIDQVTSIGLGGFVTQWNGAGYKVALLLPDRQRIESFEYGGTRLESVDAAADLNAVYGTPGGHYWAVWGLRSGDRQHETVALNVVRFKVHVRLAGPAPNPQLIPVLSRHFEGSFKASMPGLWVVRRPSS